MPDLRTAYDAASRRMDYAIAAPGLAEDDGLETAVLLSLFTDRRAEPDEAPPDGSDDRRGWWADAYASTGGDAGATDRVGSRLWLLARSKGTAHVLALARSYAEEALAWLVRDGVAWRVEVSAEHMRPADPAQAHALALLVAIHRPARPPARYRFEHVWEGR
jgi:phage gp46-like protein